MKITYNKNPLDTTIELDEFEKKELWYKVKIAEMEDLLFSTHFHLTEGQHFSIDRARLECDPKYYMTDVKSGLDARVDDLTNYFIEELQSSHVGDCICVPCSCSKCHAEELVGIDTIPGLRKHVAYKINGAFGKENERTLDEAIAYLEAYEPKADWEGWEQYIPQWKEEAKEGAEWLKAYKARHFSG